MGTRAFEWLFRTAMLAMAGLVTLSILGSIAALSTEEGPRGFLAGRPAPPAIEGEPRSDAAAPAATAGPQAEEDGGSGSELTSIASPEPAERWLEAIAFALLALAGLSAIGLLLLWRAAREIGRGADALEALSRRPPP
jgi:hypothetical protein